MLGARVFRLLAVDVAKVPGLTWEDRAAAAGAEDLSRLDEGRQPPAFLLMAVSVAASRGRASFSGHLLFPAARGGHIDLEKFRHREWAPALRAAGVEHRRIYDCRHTFASWAIAGGVQLFYLARLMGTSVAQIDATYGHLLPDSEGYLRGLLDAFDSVYGLKTDEAGR
jgi:integrase